MSKKSNMRRKTDWHPSTKSKKMWTVIQYIGIVVAILAGVFTIAQFFGLGANSNDESNMNENDNSGIMVQGGVNGNITVIQADNTVADTNIQGVNKKNSTDEKTSKYDQMTMEELFACTYDFIVGQQFDEAIECLNFMMSQDSLDRKTDAAIHYNRGFCYLSQQKYAMAIVDLEQAVKLSYYSDANYCLGIAYSDGFQKYKEAIEQYSLAIDLEPKVDYYFARAAAYVELGQTADAIQDYYSVLVLDGENVTAQERLEQLTNSIA